MKYILNSLTILIAISLSLDANCGTIACSTYYTSNSINVRGPGEMKMYFLLTRLFGSGDFEAIRRELPRLQQMNINTLMISPPNPQSTQYHTIRGKNNHGYWVLNHNEIDPRMGGEEKFKQLVSEAKSRGIKIAVDAVLNQFGYGQTFKIGGKEVSIEDPRYFIQPAQLGASGRPRAYEILDQMETNVDKDTLFRLKKELETLPLYELPTLRHNNPEVFSYLVNSYKTFIDRGIEVYRIDAAKHISSDVQARFMNELNDYAKTKGMKLTFISEFIAENSHNFGIFVKDLMAKVKDNDSVQFYDFTLRAELVRLQDPNYQFGWMMGFLNYREVDRQPIRRYIPLLEDHDFGHTVHDAFQSKLIHLVTDFFSYNSPLMYHGSEQTVQPNQTRQNRQHLARTNPNGDLAEMHKKLADLLEPYRKSQTKVETITHVADHSHLIVEKKLSENKSVFIVANRSGDLLQQALKLSGKLGAKAKIILREGDSKIELVSGGRELNLNVNGNGFLVFEITR